MKNIKKISLILAATFTLGGAAMANEAREGKRNIDPKVRAEKMTERMVKEYNLTDAQKQQLQEVNLVLVEKIGDRPAGPHRHGKDGRMAKDNKGRKDKKDGVAKENRERKEKGQLRAERDGDKKRADRPKPTAEDREKRMQEMKQVRDNYNAQLQKIMNADQYQAYTKKQTERAEKMKENRGKRPGSHKRGGQQA